MTGPELAHALDRLGMSRAELARQTGVSPSTVYRWIDGTLEVPRYAWRIVELLTDRTELAKLVQPAPARTRRPAQ